MVSYAKKGNALVRDFIAFVVKNKAIKLPYETLQILYRNDLTLERRFLAANINRSEVRILFQAYVKMRELNIVLLDSPTSLKRRFDFQIDVDNIGQINQIYNSYITLNCDTRTIITANMKDALYQSTRAEVIFLSKAHYERLLLKYMKRCLFAYDKKPQKIVKWSMLNVSCFVLFHLIFLYHHLLAFRCTTIIFALKSSITMIGAILQARNIRKTNNNKVHFSSEMIVCDETADSKKLPVYTILLPMYKENITIKQLVKAIENINYPKYLLDVKILLEQNDVGTHEEVCNIILPDFFSVVTVPHCTVIQNKPRAMNFGMMLAEGKYITVYDAEDVPHRDQITNVVHHLEKVGDDVIVQCPLGIYNRHQNIISHMLHLEYSFLFDAITPFATKSGMFVPLGGTSNHMSKDLLAKVDYWSPHNITEDFELAVKLYCNRHGTVDYLPFKTMESAVTNWHDWTTQRTRWIKGFLITIAMNFLPIMTKMFTNPLHFFGFIMLGWANLIQPIVICSMLKNFADRGFNIWSALYFLYNIITVFVSISCTSQEYNVLKRFYLSTIFTFYNLLLVIPTIRAIWHILQKSKRFYWEKTPHSIIEMNMQDDDIEDFDAKEATDAYDVM